MIARLVRPPLIVSVSATHLAGTCKDGLAGQTTFAMKDEEFDVSSIYGVLVCSVVGAAGAVGAVGAAGAAGAVGAVCEWL